MRRISRREFIQLCTGTVGGVGLLTSLEPMIMNTLAEAVEDRSPIVWLQGASCTGCSVSVLNSVSEKMEKLLSDIKQQYHPTFMDDAGSSALDSLEEVATKYKDRFLLIVEGGVPTAEEGAYCTMGEKEGKQVTFLEVVRRFGSMARAVIAAGSCAAFGGVPGGAPNPTGTVGVWEVVKDKPVINIGCCPVHPEDFLYAVGYVLNYGAEDLKLEGLKLDEYNRPQILFPEIIHVRCPRCTFFAQGLFAENPGDERCLALVGCKGMVARARCNVHQWNNQTNWCIAAGTPCQACSEPGFPDDSGPLYGRYRLHE